MPRDASQSGFAFSLASFVGLEAELYDPWWIMGGAATALIVGDTLDVHDIDVLVSPVDARRLIGILGLSDSTDGGTGRFRSEVYATWKEPPVPIDLLGGFQIMVGDHWMPVSPMTRVPFFTEAGRVFLPSTQEHIEITRLLGRPRDFERIERMLAMKK